MTSVFRALAIAIACLSVAGASWAQDVVAGWDFGQYLGPGAPSIDGVNIVSTIPANYSDFDPTFGAGAESAAFGTAFLDGTNGSTSGAGNLILPNQDSLTSNSDGPMNDVPSPDTSFDAGTVQDSEIMHAAGTLQDVSLLQQPNSAVNLVFQADRSTAGMTSGDTWSVAFGALSRSTATIAIEFSVAGGGFSQVDSITLDSNDTLYEVELGEAMDDVVAVRFALPSLAANAIVELDNVMITVPEPTSAATGLAACGVLSCVARRRAA